VNELEFVFLIDPFIVILSVIFFPFRFIVFVPVVILGGGFLGGGVGLASLIGVNLHGGGGTNTFIYEHAIHIVTLNTGHFSSS
jgi:hypothetical protein